MPEDKNQIEGCTCYNRGQCAACTLALLDAGEYEAAQETEISQSLRALGIT